MRICLSDQDLTVFLEGTAPPEAMDRWQTHLARCWPCAVRLAKTLQDPDRQTPPRAFLREILEAVEKKPAAHIDPDEGRNPIAVFLSSLWKRRLSVAERNLLRLMLRAGSRAIVAQEPNRPREVLIDGRPILAAQDPTARAEHLAALEVGLVRRGLAQTFNGRVYELTSKGRTKAESLG